MGTCITGTVVIKDCVVCVQAFANMTQMTRRALCSVMVFAVVPHEGTIVMKDGEELDSWSVILNGEVEVTRPDGSRERLQMGDRSVVVAVCHGTDAAAVVGDSAPSILM